MKLSIILVLIFSTPMLFGCSSASDCLVSDSIEKLSSFKISGNEHAVYLRTTGLSEKESFYELYSNHPKFDACGAASISPVSQVHIDNTVGKPIKLEVTGSSLTLRYSEGDVSVEVLRNIEIVVK
jgi:hypothetical protein